MSIQRWLTASHNLEMVGDRGFWWAGAHMFPGVVPPPTQIVRESPAQRLWIKCEWFKLMLQRTIAPAQA